MYGRTCCKVVVTTTGSSAVCSDLNHNLKNTSPFDHEEADTRMLVHVRDALLNGPKQLICTNYSDDFVLAVSAVIIRTLRSGLRFEQDHNLDILQLIRLQHNLDQKKIRYSSSMLCFAKSAFYSHGKKSAWNV